MKKLTSYERGFVEGLIDGEGCIEFSKRKITGKYDNTKTKSGFVWRIRLSISNKSLKLLRKMQKICGKGSIIQKSGENYELRYGSQKLRELLPQIKLIVKEKKRTIVLKALRILKWGRNQYTENYDSKLKKLLIEFKLIAKNHIE